MQVSAYASRIQPSATLAAGAKAKALQASGIEVFDFAMGEPDFDTPKVICDAAEAAMRSGKTHYTPASGIPPLKQAIADYHRRFHGLEYQSNQVCVSSGCKHTLFTALSATLNPGDEVIVPTPYWVSYSDMVQMTGAIPVLVPCPASSRFKLTAEALRRAITPKTRMLLLNSPSNPTGMAYTRSELEALADVVLERDLIVVSDEIYERLIYSDIEFQAFANVRPGLMERTLTVNGVSKTYAMTGWRIGWTCGPREVIQAMDVLQSQQTGNASSVSQYAAIAALTGDQGPVEGMKAEFRKRWDYVCDRIAGMPGLELLKPDGAFYAFFDVSGCFGKKFGDATMSNSMEFCLTLLEQGHVNLVPGSAFGAEGYARLSFAASMVSLESGLDALERWLKTAR